MQNDENGTTNAIPTDNENTPLVFDIKSIVADLKASCEPVNGLRKKVLLKSTKTLIILLSFEENGTMPEHNAPGKATINIVDGLINFKVLDKTHHLSGGQVIVIEPGVRHDLEAVEASTVLVTISK